MASHIPETILSLLPDYVNSLDDLLSLSALSKTSRSLVLRSITPSLLFGLCYRSQGRKWSPDHAEGWYLLCGVAKGISLWLSNEIPPPHTDQADQPTTPEPSGYNVTYAGTPDTIESDNTPDLGTMARRHQFKSACVFGPQGLLRLCLLHPTIPRLAGWSFGAIREMVDRWYRVVNPLADLVDKCIGTQWYNVEDFWDGGRQDAATLYAEPHFQVFQLIAYGELFGRGFTEWVDWSEQANEVSEDSQTTATLTQAWLRDRSTDIAMRMEFLKYSFIDWRTFHPYSGESWGVTVPPYPSSPGGSCLAAFGGLCGIHLGKSNPATSAAPTPNELTSVIKHFGVAVDQIASGSHLYEQREACQALHHLLKWSPLWGNVIGSLRQTLVGSTFGVDTATQTVDVADIDWRLTLWENSLWCAGWNGAELIAESWATHTENDRAKLVAERRDSNVDAISASAASVEGVEETRRHLRKTCRRIQDMTEEPMKVTVRSFGGLGGGRVKDSSSYLIPNLLGDVGIIAGRCL